MMSQSPQNLWVKGKSAYLSLNRAEVRETALYLLLLLFLPTQLGKHFWPSYSLVSGFRVDYLSPTLYVTDLLVGLLFLQWFLNHRHRTKWSFSTLLPYLLVFFFLGLTIIPSLVPLAGSYSLLRILELTFFGWYTAARLGIPSVRNVATQVLFIGVVGESLLAIAQVLSKGSLGGVFYFLGERSMTSMTPGAATAVLSGEVYLRPYGSFSHPNVLAGYLLLFLVFLFFNRSAFQFRFGRQLLYTGISLGSAALILTLSRIPLVLWGVFLVGVVVHYSKQQTKLKKGREVLSPGRIIFLGSVVFGCTLLLLPFLPFFITRFTQTSVTEEAFVVRADLTRIAWEVIQRNLLLGVGLGNFLVRSIAYRDASLPLFFAVQPVHNIFLLVLAETGILGLSMFLWFLIRSFRKAVFSARVLLLLIIVLGSFDHYLLTLQQGQLMLAFFLGYCWCLRPQKST